MRIIKIKGNKVNRREWVRVENGMQKGFRLFADYWLIHGEWVAFGGRA